MTITGYHATNRSNADNIKKEGFKPSIKPNEWLGHGVYFFTHEINAESWHLHRKKYYEEPVIIRCGINVKDEKLLDLDDPVFMNKFLKFISDIKNEENKNNNHIDFKDDEHLEICHYLDIFIDCLNLHAVSYTFNNNRTANALSFEINNRPRKYRYNEYQINVIETSCIEIKGCYDV